MTFKLGVPAAAALVVAALALPGCVEPDSKTCPTGFFCPAGSRCAARQAACIWDDCGDAVVQPGEVCDDGNKLDGDGCSANCKSNETCGNGVVDVAMGELCDDGNNVDGDGCSADCRSVEGCGNGVVDPGEECDSGPSGVPNVGKETPACNANCTWARHGDGVVNASAGEQCDGDNGRTCESATCNADCTPSACGDGVRNALAGEACDEGLYNSDTGDCLRSCQANACGDGHENQSQDQFGNPKEECDEGSANSDDGACLRNCRRAACGDAHVQAGVETCDTGPESVSVKSECPYGQRACTLCSACQSVPLTGPYCGDTIQQPNEACDDGDDNGATSCPYGTRSCTICNATCTARVQRSGPYCGDGSKNGDEACDLGTRNGQTTCLYGPRTCELCSATCQQILPATPHFCTDGTRDVDVLGIDGQRHTEVCDDSRSFACGTCDTATCTKVDLAPARGTITVTSTAFGDGDTFVLDDGVHTPVTFELNAAGECQLSGTVCVDLTGATMDTAAGVIETAVNGVEGTLLITAAHDGSSTTQLRLTNGSNGIAGNNSIVTTGSSIVVAPATSAIVVQGMSGGTGCATDAPCGYDADCLSGDCKRNHTCNN